MYTVQIVASPNWSDLDKKIDILHPLQALKAAYRRIRTSTELRTVRILCNAIPIIEITNRKATVKYFDADKTPQVQALLAHIKNSL